MNERDDRSGWERRVPGLAGALRVLAYDAQREGVGNGRHGLQRDIGERVSGEHGDDASHPTFHEERVACERDQPLGASPILVEHVRV